jgi:hypothetical protein
MAFRMFGGSSYCVLLSIEVPDANEPSGGWSVLVRTVQELGYANLCKLTYYTDCLYAADYLYAIDNRIAWHGTISDQGLMTQSPFNCSIKYLGKTRVKGHLKCVRNQRAAKPSAPSWFPPIMSQPKRERKRDKLLKLFRPGSSRATSPAPPTGTIRTEQAQEETNLSQEVHLQSQSQPETPSPWKIAADGAQLVLSSLDRCLDGVPIASNVVGALNVLLEIANVSGLSIIVSTYINVGLLGRR